MSEFQPLIDQLFWERVERARRMTPGERTSEALELSAFWFDGPDPELVRRLELVREMENRMYYGPPKPRL